MAVTRTTCKSSYIRAFRYCPVQKILEVEFGPPLTGDESKDKPSSFGHYVDVPEESFGRFRGSPSHGAHLTKHIIPSHEYKAGPAF